MSIKAKTKTKRTQGAKRDGGFARSSCAIACALDVIGDKWSLLVVRDLFRGKSTYGELLESPERIPTNTLADRLSRLEESGILVRTAYQENPVRYAYTLTEKGRGLGEILLATARWSKQHIPGTQLMIAIGAGGSGKEAQSH